MVVQGAVVSKEMSGMRQTGKTCRKENMRFLQRKIEICTGSPLYEVWETAFAGDG